MIYRLALLAILLAGCRNGSKPSPAPGDTTPSTLGAAPAQFSDLAPGDTAAVVDMMRQLMRGIDAGTPAMVQRDTSFGGGADTLVHRLTVWVQDGVPRKLVAIDSSTTARNNTETDVWFMGGDVAIVLQVADAYAFDSDRIVLWTDEALTPRTEVTAELLMAKQTELITMVQRWLDAIGIHPPQ